jgi:hypothetical protein
MQCHGIGARRSGNGVRNGHSGAFRLIERIFDGIGNGIARAEHARNRIKVNVGPPESILRIGIAARGTAIDQESSIHGRGRAGSQDGALGRGQNDDGGIGRDGHGNGDAHGRSNRNGIDFNGGNLGLVLGRHHGNCQGGTRCGHRHCSRVRDILAANEAKQFQIGNFGSSHVHVKDAGSRKPPALE